MLIPHLKKECRHSAKFIYSEDGNEIDILRAMMFEQISKDTPLEDIWIDFMIYNGLSTCFYSQVAEKMVKTYNGETFDIDIFAKGLSYAYWVQRLSSYKDTLIGVSKYVSFVMLARISNKPLLLNFSLPVLRGFNEIMCPVNKGEKLESYQLLLEQFPMYDFLCDDQPDADKAHAFVKQAYNIDSRKNPEATYKALVEDHIKYTKLFKHVQTSIYAEEPLNFIPLEIIYLSTFIELPLQPELVDIREKLKNIPTVTDDGIEALENYVNARMV